MVASPPQREDLADAKPWAFQSAGRGVSQVQLALAHKLRRLLQAIADLTIVDMPLSASNDGILRAIAL
ncbi:MAG: hypothetical protein EBZ03_06035 [Betaproteobacteria bacterium]|nr:hypothetical protein [Betaproteobacteria bacterium]NBO44013.1 hypothetical protein [Betaproteobacteria bacterium]NBP10825.1 hypothetical protein [Betaproteobacteria bacterium]NBP61472.1 hypothetical protein [Betaproteobacteria bacterium]NBQ08566.1 hypothetical protein [Betaproteobacteria bacterium]